MAPDHKRSASVRQNGTKPSGPSAAALFVANLRLLDLDILPDWPAITVSSFNDARGKIKSTEYALYQLFRIHDPATTAEKLQPFFPPLEPLQSVNLRAALYRCLNEMKKNGTLPRETVLRKTMLDECQGDKFWEVCLAFSTMVLERVTLQIRGPHDNSMVDKMAMSPSLSRSQQESMLPLAIAHKATLRKILREKQRKRETYTALYDVLEAKEEELRQRKVQTEDWAKNIKTLKVEKLNAAEIVVRKHWIGSTELRDALIEGDTCAKGDGMLVKSFDSLWQTGPPSARAECAGAEIGLLQIMNEKAADQAARLRRWQNYHEKLLAAKPRPHPPSRSAGNSQKTVFQFDRHHAINPHDMEAGSVPLPSRARAKPPDLSRYTSLLFAMRHDLRRTSALSNPDSTTAPTRSAPKQAKPVITRSETQPIRSRRQLSMASVVSGGSSDPQSPSPTTVPLRNPLGKPSVSRSRSYQQPKVDSQREPIQLKSELFSPLRSGRVSASPVSSGPILASPVADSLSAATTQQAQDGRCASVPEAVGGAVDDDTVADSVAETSGGSKDSPSTSTPSESEEAAAEDFELKKPSLPTHTTNPQSRATLAERTRMSMAFNGLDRAKTAASDVDDRSVPTPDSPPPVPSVPTTNRHTTLQDRTRQSISLAPTPTAPVPHSRKPSHARTRSSLHPPQHASLATPARRPSTVIERRDGTPVEELLSPEAEYDSVFKSRPKIALSPVLSAQRDRVGEEEVEVGRSREVGRSSPMVDVGSGE